MPLPYRCRTYSVSECPLGISVLNLLPSQAKMKRAAADAIAYPINAVIPAVIAASAGLNRIQAPIPDATRDAIAAPNPNEFLEER